MIKFGRLNIIVGAITIFVAAAGGMALGLNLESNFKGGVYIMTLSHALIKAGHTHGMPFAFYNLIVGMLVDRLTVDDKLKKYCSICAALTVLMPIGLALRGLFDGSKAFEPIPMTGALCFLISAGIILKGALALKAE